MVSAGEVADTIKLLAPGFVALKIFYQFGLRTRRTDLEWTLWSVLAAFVIAPVGPWLTEQLDRDIEPIWLALVVGAVLGIALSMGWIALVRVWPGARLYVSRMAWDAVLPNSRWIQVWTSDGRTVSGAVRNIADPAETDELDLYVEQPAWVDDAGNVTDMTGIEGLLIARDKIEYIQTFKR